MSRERTVPGDLDRLHQAFEPGRVFSLQEARAKLGWGYGRAAHHLQEWCREGKVLRKGSGKATRYSRAS